MKEKLSPMEIKILREISFYFGQNVNKLGIKAIKVKRNKIYILLSCPGLFIGKHGRDINELTERLSNSICLIKKPQIILSKSNIDNHLNFY